jgi:hypothetical protein
MNSEYVDLSTYLERSGYGCLQDTIAPFTWRLRNITTGNQESWLHVSKQEPSEYKAHRVTATLTCSVAEVVTVYDGSHLVEASLAFLENEFTALTAKPRVENLRKVCRYTAA